MVLLDKLAYWTVKSLRWPTDIFFQVNSPHSSFISRLFPIFFLEHRRRSISGETGQRKLQLSVDAEFLVINNNGR
jgi:hypothetical protein